MKEDLIVKIMGGGVIGFLTYLFGAWDNAIQILLIFIVIDYLTGFVASASEGKLSSVIGFKGIMKKLFILVAVVVAVQLDRLVGQVNVFRLAVCFFYTANEGISIIENLARGGVPIPKFMIKFLNTMKEQSNEGGA